MATLLPPVSKKQKRLAQQPQEVEEEFPADLPNVMITFQAADTGSSIGGNIRIPGNSTEKQLELLLNKLLQNDDESVPYTFSLLKKDDNSGQDTLIDITDNLYKSVIKPGHKSTEDQFTIVYTPRQIFRVRAITRSAATMSGHGSTVLAVQFAPHTSDLMVSGSGDGTARIWDCLTRTPLKTLTGHNNWVLTVSWSPDGKLIATGSMDNTIRVWDPKTGKQVGSALTGHSKWITALSWEPYHLVEVGQSPRLASSSKDGTVRVWDVETHICQYTMSGHRSTVSCVKWGGFGDIYSTSHDKTIKVWSSKDGRLVSTLKAHAHWVNHISLSTDYALRTGPFDEKGFYEATQEEYKAKALMRFEALAKLTGTVTERVVTASDDFTMYLWEPRKSDKPICRLTGHQKLVNHVSFSPDGRHIASASFDNSIKLWNGRDGTFITTFRGHVAAVYQCAWSSDCRLLVSSSKDTTLKVWNITTKKLQVDLPGHLDEVYAVDWSVDGKAVGSGGKDKKIKLWTH